MVEASSNFIVYDLATIETGFLEFDVKGLDIRNPTRDARHLFFMWDPSLGSDMTENRFRVSLQKLDGRSSINDRWLRLRFISQGRQIDVGSTFRGWEPAEHLPHPPRVGPRRRRQRVPSLHQRQPDVVLPVREALHPADPRIELGAAQRAETPEGAIYSNVTIGTR